MKRFLICLMIILLLPLAACVGGSVPFSAHSPGVALFGTPAPSPTPEPPRVIAVFGADEDAAFLAGVQAAAKEANEQIEILSVSGGVDALKTFAPEKANAAIVYLTSDSQTLPKTTIPVYAYAASGQSVSGEIAYLGYDASGAAKTALGEALLYPPHLAPVRMLGLFTSQSSAAYALWSSEKTAGQVFAKKEFFADAPEVPLSDWLSESFAAFYPGMLDAVFAETGALAVAAAEALASLGRDDVEVFSAGTDAQAMEKLSPILICVVGASQSGAGARCYAEAAKLVAGEPAQSGILLPEPIWYQATEK